MRFRQKENFIYGSDCGIALAILFYTTHAGKHSQPKKKLPKITQKNLSGGDFDYADYKFNENLFLGKQDN